MYRVGTKQFPTHEAAQEWIDRQSQGNYEIIQLSWCGECRYWMDTDLTEDGEVVCRKCR